jgi:hypothetical protein
MSQTRKKNKVHRLHSQPQTLQHAHTDDQLGHALAAIVNHTYVVVRKNDPTGAGALWALKTDHWHEQDLRDYTTRALADPNLPGDLRELISQYIQKLEAEVAAEIAPSKSASIEEIFSSSAGFTLENYTEEAKHLVRLGAPFAVIQRAHAKAADEVCAEHDAIIDTTLRNRAQFDLAYGECRKFTINAMQRAGQHLRDSFGLQPEEIISNLRTALTMKSGGRVFVSPHMHHVGHSDADEPEATH